MLMLSTDKEMFAISNLLRTVTIMRPRTVNIIEDISQISFHLPLEHN